MAGWSRRTGNPVRGRDWRGSSRFWSPGCERREGSEISPGRTSAGTASDSERGEMRSVSALDGGRKWWDVSKEIGCWDQKRREVGQRGTSSDTDVIREATGTQELMWEDGLGGSSTALWGTLMLGLREEEEVRTTKVLKTQQHLQSADKRRWWDRLGGEGWKRAAYLDS